MDPGVQSAVISAVTSILVLFLTGLGKWAYDRYSLRQKLSIEYTFAQRKRIKEEISKTKTPLLQSAEDLNHRLWNLNNHIHEGWLDRKPEEWLMPAHYYIRSFVYRYLRTLSLLLEAESSVFAVDSTLSTREDLLYLKHVIAMRNCLCDRLLIKGLGYGSSANDNHFYRDELSKFSSYMREKDRLVAFHEFEVKIQKDAEPVQKVFLFFSKVKCAPGNRSLNMLHCLHLLLLSFLNRFGHEYQRTPGSKIEELAGAYYQDFTVLKCFREFLKRHELANEMRAILQYWESDQKSKSLWAFEFFGKKRRNT